MIVVLLQQRDQLPGECHLIHFSGAKLWYVIQQASRRQRRCSSFTIGGHILREPYCVEALLQLGRQFDIVKANSPVYAWKLFLGRSLDDEGRGL